MADQVSADHSDRRWLVDRVVSRVVVGRDDELEVLAANVRRPPCLVAVEGEAGVGKTRMVTELVEHHALEAHRWFIGACARIPEPFPLGPVIDALRDLDPTDEAWTSSPVIGALRPLIPELDASLPPALPPLDDRAAARHRVVRALEAVVTAVGPSVLVIEDLHWADDRTLDFLSYLLSQSPRSLSIVVTYRGDELDPSMRETITRLPATMRRTTIHLDPLDAGGTGRLAAAILGAPHVSDEFAEHLWTKSSGLPFVVEELLALLRARGSIRRRGSAWARRTLDELDVPSRLRDAVLERIAGLSTDAQALIDAAALVEEAVPAAVLTEIAAVGTDLPSPGGLAEALDSGLLVERGGELGFRHLLGAQAVAERMPATARRELHAQAARVLAHRLPGRAGNVAHHLEQAGRKDEWVTAARHAADRAIELGHDGEATRLLEAVLRSDALHPAERGSVAVQLAWTAIGSVYAPASIADLLMTVVDTGLDPPVRGELRFLLALLREQVGADPLEVRARYLASVEDLGERPDLQAWAMMGLGIHTASGITIAEHGSWIDRVVDLLADLDDPAFRRFLTGKAAMALVSVGDVRWRELTAWIEAATDGVPQGRREISAYQSVGMAACSAGHHDAAKRLLAAAGRAAMGPEYPKLGLWVRSSDALRRHCDGDWSTLDAELDGLMDELTDHPTARIDVDVVAGCQHLARGRADAAVSRLRSAAAEARAAGALELAAIATEALIRQASEQRRIAEAVELTDDIVAALDAKGFWLPFTRLLPSAVRALVTADRVADAWALRDRCVEQLADLDAPLASAVSAHATGLLIGAADPSAAVTQLDDAGAAYAQVSAPYEAARAFEHAAQIGLAVGEDRGSACWTRAMAAYRDLGATWDADRTAQMGRAHGMSVPGRDHSGQAGYGSALSPRERQVAELASLGKTNREIADALFLSPKTVEKHVGAALRKLGLRSRAGLGRRLSPPA